MLIKSSSVPFRRAVLKFSDSSGIVFIFWDSISLIGEILLSFIIILVKSVKDYYFFVWINIAISVCSNLCSFLFRNVIAGFRFFRSDKHLVIYLPLPVYFLHWNFLAKHSGRILTVTPLVFRRMIDSVFSRRNCCITKQFDCIFLLLRWHSFYFCWRLQDIFLSYYFSLHFKK